MTYFIHQHSVDAFHAQTADEHTKPIGLIFALLGLYLFLERNYSGKQVQLAHMKLAENKKPWPAVPLPAQRGVITVASVLKAEPGKDRDWMITEWCGSVWNAYSHSHPVIKALARNELHLSCYNTEQS